MLNTIGYKLDVIKAYNDKQIYTDNNLHMITWDAELPDIIREYQFVLAMSQLNMNPDTTIIFEDSVPGLKAANSSGAGIVIKVDNSADTKEKLIKLLDA